MNNILSLSNSFDISANSIKLLQTDNVIDVGVKLKDIDTVEQDLQSQINQKQNRLSNTVSDPKLHTHIKRRRRNENDTPFNRL